MRLLYLCHFSHPGSERPLYRAIRRTGPRRIVEIGLGDCRRAIRLIRAARLVHPAEPICYTGIDLFEAGSDPSLHTVSLRQAYQLLRATGAAVRLVPGPCGAALARVANTLLGTDLLIIAHRADEPALRSAWFYVPRMLHERSQVLVYQRQGDRIQFARLSSEEISRLASAGSRPLQSAA